MPDVAPIVGWIAVVIAIASVAIIVIRPLTRSVIYPIHADLELSPPRRRAIRKRAAVISTLPMWVMYAGWTLVIPIFFIFRYWLFPWFDSIGKDHLGNILFWITMATAPGSMMLILGRRLCARAVYKALREEGFEVCWTCGYLLVNLQPKTRKCPECGAWRRPL